MARPDTAQNVFQMEQFAVNEAPFSLAQPGVSVIGGRMMIRMLCAACFATLAMNACATASLSAGGKNVTPTTSAPGPECENLGTVIGQGGGTFGGAYISNDSLMQYALNDALNKAASKGATHLQTAGPQLGGGSGTTTTATVMGVAYKCPKGTAAPSGSTPAPEQPKQ